MRQIQFKQTTIVMDHEAVMKLQHASKHKSLPLEHAARNSILPIDDFYLLDNPNRYCKEEKELRIKLASLYRLIDINGWSMGILNHVTAKLIDSNTKREALLIHPFGLHYSEITASSLLKLDMETGRVLDRGSTNYGVNWPGYLIHSGVHLGRSDVGCVAHAHSPFVGAASSYKAGLLPVCQEYALLGEVKYFDYDGVPTEEEEGAAMAAALGTNSRVMVLRNHGLLVAARSVEEAYHLMMNAMLACETQAHLLATGINLNDIITMSSEAANQAYDLVEQARYPVEGLNTGKNSSLLYKLEKQQQQQITTLLDDDTKESEEMQQAELASINSSTSGHESDYDSSISTSSSSSSSSLSLANLSISKQITKSDTNIPHFDDDTKHKSESLAREMKENDSKYITMQALAFEAAARSLDLRGHKTGYPYKYQLKRYYKQNLIL